MLRCILVAFAILAATSNAWGESVFLRCIAAEPANRKDGRYAIAAIDLSRDLLELRDHHSGGTITTTYRITNANADRNKGVLISESPRPEFLNIDRVSGRITRRLDVTDDADKLWNDAKNQIGGFDLPEGARLYSTIHFDCQPHEPVM